MQENALSIPGMALEQKNYPVTCSLKKYYPNYFVLEEYRKIQERGLFVWESDLCTQHGNGFILEQKFELEYHPPKNPNALRRFFGAKVKEKNVPNSISLELTIRNLRKDKDLLKKICLGSHLGGDVYFIGDSFGASIGPYHGEDIRLDFTERLLGQVLFGIPLFDRGHGFEGGGMPRSFQALSEKTKPFEDYLRNVVLHLTHTTSKYSKELGEELSQREAQYFQRHVELIQEYLSVQSHGNQPELALSGK